MLTQDISGHQKFISGIQSIQQEGHMKVHNLTLTKELQNKQFHVKNNVV